ncbi:MAG: aspartate/tyrosine/aromatic aminotransferase [Propionibacteriaceae bacterium]|jgi:aromatic-amino-acid transaminase|nr:aspartate/tyrosine/aromatic aminotransferase [Propionibacteriaceae bacterium]
MSVFSSLLPVPADPILGVTEAFNADPHPDKINLGVGVYTDQTGVLPLMDCVRAAEQDIAAHPRAHAYLPQEGMAAYDDAVQQLVFGESSPARLAGRVVTAQTLGGTGALRVGAGLLRLANPQVTVLISSPSWENHRLIFERTGFAVEEYRYYDQGTGGVDVDGMVADLEAADPGSIVVLHGCCHNPTGSDLTAEQWDRVIEVLVRRGLVPFVDLAYQGLSQGLVEDRYAVEALVRADACFVVANSFSKNFGLYGERVGAVHFVAASSDEAARVRSQAKTVIRSLYSSPSTYGAAIVARVLTTAELAALWEQEVDGMRGRIKQMRAEFRSGLEAAGVTQDLSYITTQAGMFSYSGLSPRQMMRLREQFHVYGLDSGRLCVAALNPGNLDRVIEAVAAVMTS